MGGCISVSTLCSLEVLCCVNKCSLEMRELCASVGLTMS